MNHRSWTWGVAVLAMGVATGGGAADEITVTLDVWPDDPNDPNGPRPLIQVDAGDPIDYYITALVEPNDPNVTSGLGAAYVTLHTTFDDANLLGLPEDVHGTLSEYASTGLVLSDDVTDIGGSQDLIGDNMADELALGETIVVAAGTLTAPQNDGTYHVCVTPQAVSVLAADLTQGPTGQLPDAVDVGQGFYVVVGDPNYYWLMVEVIPSDTHGHVEKDPDLHDYPYGMQVTLTAVPNPSRNFIQWRHYDPNDGLDPNDANDPRINDSNYFKRDTNNPTMVVMDQRREIVALFSGPGCGGGMGAMLPLGGLMAFLTGVWLFRRLRMHS